MEDIAAVSSRTVPPDPSIADALGAHHELPTALADLVDNSIDAGASQVRIRILTDDDYVTGMLVIDDGHGMDEAGIDAAMALSRRRDYGETDLGHYGLGLKAASLSQADTLDVYARAIGGVPVGRRITREEPTLVQSLDAGQVGEVLEGSLVRMTDAAPLSGTVVRWRGFRTAVVAPDRDERRSWLSRLVESIRGHLGLVFHRIIARGDVEIAVDEYDLGLGRAGSVRRVRALDPLALDASAAHPYRLAGEVGEVPFDLTAVILKGAVLEAPGVEASRRLSPAEGGQGLYVYRNDRLLQLGGWNSIIDGGRDYANLRISLDVGDALLDVVRINPEKSGVVLEPEMGRAVHASVGAGHRNLLSAPRLRPQCGHRGAPEGAAPDPTGRAARRPQPGRLRRHPGLRRIRRRRTHQDPVGAPAGERPGRSGPRAAPAQDQRAPPASVLHQQRPPGRPAAQDPRVPALLAFLRGGLPGWAGEA